MLLVMSQITAASCQEFDQLLEENGLSDPPPTKPVEKTIHGVVIEQKKYSIILRSGLETFQIKLPQRTPILRELIRPSLQLSESKLEFTLPCSGAGGDQSKNRTVELPLPEKVHLLASFNSERNLKAFLSGRSNTLNQYSLHQDAQPALKDHQLAGVLSDSGSGLTLETVAGRFNVELGGRTSFLSGFTILDLTPGVEASIQVRYVEDQWIAQEIHFQQASTNVEITSSELPRILSLGDMVSFSYQRALHERFNGQFQVHHPPVNCGGSDNWPRLNRWLGDYVEHPWDVVLFNTGMLDHQLEKQQYQENLRRWIEAIQPAGKQLVWLTTTPVQGNRETPSSSEVVGKVPGRMKLQNIWAAEVMKEFPEIQVCDLWELVDEGRETGFKQWWNTKRPQFNYKQSKLIAEAIASVLMN